MNRYTRHAIAIGLLSTLPLFLTVQAAPGPAPVTPQTGGTLIIVTHQKPAHLDAGVHTSRYTQMINQQTHDSLIWQVEANKFAPGLAERWEIAPDFKSYTFYLRRDVRFHDGTPMTAESVKFTWDRIRDPKTRSTRSPQLGDYVRTEVIDQYTVRVIFADPYPQFIQIAAHIGIGPVSPAAVQRLGDGFLKTPVATGPFKVESWPNENTLVLVRNADYRWGPAHMRNRGPAYLDRIIYKFIEEEQTKTLAIEKREAHIAEDPSRQQAPMFRTDPRFQLLMHKTAGVPQHWPFNVTRWPTSDAAVRRAASYALDREKIARIAFFNTATAAKGPLTDTNWAFWPDSRKYYPHDPQRAVELLEGAGYKRNPNTKFFEKDGRPVRMRLVTTSTWEQIRAATLAQQMMKEVGIDFVVEAMVYDATVIRYSNNDYELARLGLSTFDPDGLWGAFHSSQITEGSQWNRGRLTNKELDALLDRGRELSNPEQRKQVYFQAQKMLLDMANALYVFEDNYFFAGQSCVKGWHWNILGMYELHNVWVEGDCRRIQ
ncbi:MAG: ABC transporter substrate-binding protein [Armatimonadota bacterium]